jgi:hypothetical protein
MTIYIIHIIKFKVLYADQKMPKRIRGIISKNGNKFDGASQICWGFALFMGTKKNLSLRKSHFFFFSSFLMKPYQTYQTGRTGGCALSLNLIIKKVLETISE